MRKGTHSTNRPKVSLSEKDRLTERVKRAVFIASCEYGLDSLERDNLFNRLYLEYVYEDEVC